MSSIPSDLIDNIQHMKYEQLLTKLEDCSIDVLLTDPPYNINILGVDWDKGFDLESWLNSVLPKIKQDGLVMIFNTESNVRRVIKPFVENFHDKDHNFTVVDIIDWGKTNPRENIDTVRQFEFLLIAYNNYNTSKSDRYYLGDFDPSFNNEEWQTASELKMFALDKVPVEDKQGKKNKHPDPKPVRLINELIRKYTRLDDIILDTFSGSASIEVSSYYMSRHFIACEMEEKYIKVALKRLERVKKTVPRSLFLGGDDDEI
ncbi:DNA-methyltransferase [Companilactobacillus insicii]|uniref:DNA-methyltransferase n=1 Tax=Companilactobacillus insicii TaxID=1732567 RepID=UPI000F76D418|nr:site-specific DNA-methyltransferase [Companilactobacillus insicii]